MASASEKRKEADRQIDRQEHRKTESWRRVERDRERREIDRERGERWWKK